MKVDGESLSRVAWGGPVPIDPGPHALVATAPGKMEWDFTVQIGASQDKAVSVPVLADAPPASTPTSTAMSVAGASTEPTPSGSSGMTSSERPSRPADRTKRNVGFVVGGVGIVALGVGAFFGVAAISKRKASNDFCSGSTCTDQRGIDDNNNAKRFATFADIGLGVGVAGIAAGVYLLMTSRGTTPASASPPVSARLRVMPEFGRQGGSLVLSGAW